MCIAGLIFNDPSRKNLRNISSDFVLCLCVCAVGGYSACLCNVIFIVVESPTHPKVQIDQLNLFNVVDGEIYGFLMAPFCAECGSGAVKGEKFMAFIEWVVYIE